MTLKYEKLDSELFSWLRRQRRHATTAQAISALNVTCPATQRHISRRFSQLEDRGTLSCELQGTTRVCEVVGELPTTLAKRRSQVMEPKPVNQNIAANDSAEFVANGGQIEHLPAMWDDPQAYARKGSLPLGESVYALPFYSLGNLD